MMITRYEHEGVRWIDLESPTPDEVNEVAQELSLGPILPQDLLTPTGKQRVDVYPDFAYAILHFPSSRHTHGRENTHEVDFVIGKDFILTAHYSTVPAVYDFSRAFEAESLMRRATRGAFKSGHVLLELTERLYRSVENELEALEDSIGAIEREIFSGHEKEMVVAISSASRELLTLKRALSAQTDVLAALEQTSIMTLGEEYGNYLRGVRSFHARVFAHAAALTEVLSELRATNIALVSTRQNEITKNLTIMAFVTFPLTLIAALFGMNTLNTPLVGDPNDFWIILSGMAILMAGFFAYFKLNKWI
jgi:magnesium/cobalt transport protein CorA